MTKRKRLLEALRDGPKSTRELAELSGLNINSALKAAAEFEEAGLIQLERLGSGRRPSSWRLAPDRLADADDPKKVASA